MKKYFINETYTASAGQQVFNVEKPFINEAISVFLNGQLQTFGDGKDYVTSQDTGRIIFQCPLQAGDTVAIVSNVMSRRLNLEVISPGRADKPNALYKKYGTVERLKTNNKYEVCICVGQELFRWNFVTKLNPMFTTIRKIWEDIGEFIEGFTDEYIASMIYRNSLSVLELVDELAEEDIENVTYQATSDGEYTWSSSAPKDWVRYKTEIDLIMARYYGISLRYGTQKKEVGDISIEKSIKLPYIDNLLDRLKNGWKEADDKIRGVNVVAYGVKGIDNYSYDDWARTTNF